MVRTARFAWDDSYRGNPEPAADAADTWPLDPPEQKTLQKNRNRSKEGRFPKPAGETNTRRIHQE